MTIAVIQARMTSTRLPGKVLLPLPFPEGTPLIGFLCNKLKRSDRIGAVVVAIPEGKKQERLRTWLIQHNQELIEGPEEDVLARFALANEKYRPDTVIRITADNPFIDLEMLEQSLEKHRQAGVDYTVSSGLPYGMNLEIMHGPSIPKLHTHAELNDHDREHVTPGFRRITGMSMQTITLLEEDMSRIRVTVDTAEDYMRAALLAQIQAGRRQTGDLDFIRMAYKQYPYIF